MKRKKWKLKIRGKRVVAKDAEGVKGCLIREAFGGHVFRVYKGSEFTDYDIHHADLDIEISKDAHAALYDDGKRQWLDYDPKTLFLTKKGQKTLKRVSVKADKVFKRDKGGERK